MSVKTKIKILTNRIETLEFAIKSNDKKHLSKWHGGMKWAIKDLIELKQRLKEAEAENERD